MTATVNSETRSQAQRAAHNKPDSGSIAGILAPAGAVRGSKANLNVRVVSRGYGEFYIYRPVTIIRDMKDCATCADIAQRQLPVSNRTARPRRWTGRRRGIGPRRWFRR